MSLYVNPTLSQTNNNNNNFMIDWSFDSREKWIYVMWWVANDIFNAFFFFSYSGGLVFKWWMQRSESKLLRKEWSIENSAYLPSSVHVLFELSPISFDFWDGSVNVGQANFLWICQFRTDLCFEIISCMQMFKSFSCIYLVFVVVLV